MKKRRRINVLLPEAVPLMEFIYLVFTRMPGESSRGWLKTLLYLCYVFQALINTFVSWFFPLLSPPILQTKASYAWPTKNNPFCFPFRTLSFVFIQVLKKRRITFVSCVFLQENRYKQTRKCCVYWNISQQHIAGKEHYPSAWISDWLIYDNYEHRDQTDLASKT